MAKTPAELEKEFTENAKEKTGRTMDQWLAMAKASGMKKQMEILNWLKKDHGLNHMQAGFVASIYLNGGKAVYQNEDNLLDIQFNKAEPMRPLYDLISEKILSAYPDTQVIAKKTYISFTAKREFAAVNIKPGEIRLGFDLGDKPFTEVLQKSKLAGPMPRISHMIILKDPKDFDKDAVSLLKESYTRCHTK
jgi:hypothetical protein